MGINHILLHVKSIEVSKAFYAKTLKPLGYTMHLDFGTTVGFGIGKQRPDFWLSEAKDETAVSGPSHIGFQGNSHEEVRAWYEAAIEAGGKDNGPPGVREMYSPKYYAAFVFDPDGHNIECDAYPDEAYNNTA